MPDLFDGPLVEAVDGRLSYGETRINCLGEIEGQLTSSPTPGAARNPPDNQREESQCAKTKTSYARVER